MLFVMILALAGSCMAQSSGSYAANSPPAGATRRKLIQQALGESGVSLPDDTTLLFLQLQEPHKKQRPFIRNVRNSPRSELFVPEPD